MSRKLHTLNLRGEGVVTAADIQVDSDIQILNPDLVIANLNGGADCKLYMELTITKGRGYVSAEKNKTEDTPIGCHRCRFYLYTGGACQPFYREYTCWSDYRLR